MLPIALADPALEDLASLLAREVVVEDDHLRHLEIGQPRADVLADGIFGHSGGRLGIEMDGDRLAELFIGDAKHRDIADPVELARQSDYLMVACKGGAETRHLVSAAVIDALGAKGTLVNVARGSVVDERALASALAEGRLGHAALDVFESEPNPSPALLKLPNVIVQPHHGSATIEIRMAIGQLMIDNLSAHFAGRPLLTPVL